MSKQKANNSKVKIGFRRRLGIYYARFMMVVKIIILLIIALFLFTNFFQVQKQKIFNKFVDITAEAGFVLKYLTIQGQKNMPDSHIMEAIGLIREVPIYSLNIDDIRKRIENNPWVKLVLVQRKLPDTLYIAINEREPIAIWQFNQKLYLIDEEGNRITSNDIDKFSELIHVVGQDANVYARGLREDLDRHPALAKKVVSAVRYGQRRWDLNLEQKINVKMPDKGFNDAYDYLDRLNADGKLFNQDYKIINLRDPSKYYLEKYEM